MFNGFRIRSGFTCSSQEVKVLAPSWVLVRNGRRSKQYKDTTAWIIYVYVLDQAFDHLDKTLIG